MRPINGGCVHYIMVSEVRGKLFWLATHPYIYTMTGWVAKSCILWCIAHSPHFGGQQQTKTLKSSKIKRLAKMLQGIWISQSQRSWVPKGGGEKNAPTATKKESPSLFLWLLVQFFSPPPCSEDWIVVDSRKEFRKKKSFFSYYFISPHQQIAVSVFSLSSIFFFFFLICLYLSLSLLAAGWPLAMARPVCFSFFLHCSFLGVIMNSAAFPFQRPRCE